MLSIHTNRKYRNMRYLDYACIIEAFSFLFWLYSMSILFRNIIEIALIGYVAKIFKYIPHTLIIYACHIKSIFTPIFLITSVYKSNPACGLKAIFQVINQVSCQLLYSKLLKRRFIKHLDGIKNTKEFWQMRYKYF